MSAMFGSGVDPDDGTACGACDGTGHVCSDDGTATAPAGHHGDQLHPWDGLSHRADACDHGGGAPCPVCMIPPGQQRYRAPDVVDAVPLVRPTLSSNPTGLDRVRDAVRRDRGEVTGAELEAHLRERRAATRRAVLDAFGVPPEVLGHRADAPAETWRQPSDHNPRTHPQCTAYVARHGQHGGITRCPGRLTSAGLCLNAEAHRVEADDRVRPGAFLLMAERSESVSWTQRETLDVAGYRPAWWRWLDAARRRLLSALRGAPRR